MDKQLERLESKIDLLLERYSTHVTEDARQFGVLKGGIALLAFLITVGVPVAVVML